MRELIEVVFAKHLNQSSGGGKLDTQSDAVLLKDIGGAIYTTVDGFAVHPIEFPGGNIGSLAVHGTVNDLAVAGAIPKYLTLSAILEEGLEIAVLDRIVRSLAASAELAGVRVVAGDTKVVPRGNGGGIYFSVSGIGAVDEGFHLSMNNIMPGDAILLSGTVGDHGTAVMLAREEFGLHGDLCSDSACILPLTRCLSGVQGVRFLRDPTRGGLATVAQEISTATGFGIRLYEKNIPVSEQVSSICEILGYDPLYLACEGRCVAIVQPDMAEHVLQLWTETAGGEGSAIIGRVESDGSSVLLETAIGGVRRLEELEDDPLPRIC
jgi:hydrogenase expression/formation protein HypE